MGPGVLHVGPAFAPLVDAAVDVLRASGPLSGTDLLQALEPLQRDNLNAVRTIYAGDGWMQPLLGRDPRIHVGHKDPDRATLWDAGHASSIGEAPAACQHAAEP